MIAWYWITLLCLAAVLRSIGTAVAERSPAIIAAGERRRNRLETGAAVCMLALSIAIGSMHGFWTGLGCLVGACVLSSVLLVLVESAAKTASAGPYASRGHSAPAAPDQSFGHLPVLEWVASMTEDGACCTYFVTFSDLQSEAHDVEYVRIPLHYYAKILYVLDPTDQDAAAIAAWLASMVGRVLEAGIAPGVDVLALADIDDVARIATSPSPGPSRRMSATLYFVNASVRHIVTEFAEVIYLQRLAFSVLVMLQSCIDALDKEGVAMLAAALGEMQRMYDGGVSYSEEKSLAQVPNLAFLAVA